MAVWVTIKEFSLTEMAWPVSSQPYKSLRTCCYLQVHLYRWVISIEKNKIYSWNWNILSGCMCIYIYHSTVIWTKVFKNVFFSRTIHTDHRLSSLHSSEFLPPPDPLLLLCLPSEKIKTPRDINRIALQETMRLDINPHIKTEWANLVRRERSQEQVIE